MDKCQNCKFWDVGKRGNRGLMRCRRYPPPGTDSPNADYWPMTLADDWCGEFKDAMHEHQSADA